ncbi:MAG: M20/M25/M40 family metallo-hydrolase, partial [Chloroflexi bacterium]
MTQSVEHLRAAARQSHAAMVQFTQEMIAIPSLSGHEEQMAARVQQEMQRLNFDDVWVDQAGNVIGVVNGGPGPALILNGHMDHVDAGAAENWPHPPFEAKIVGDQLWGRGSVDMKGPVACMIYAAAISKNLPQKPAGNIFVTVAVMEEIGGLGSQFLTTHLGANVAICGEPSHNTLRRGHRGRVELQVEFLGRSAHASTPHLGVNPHFGAAALLARLGEIPLPVDDSLGPSTVVPTLYST